MNVGENGVLGRGRLGGSGYIIYSDFLFENWYENCVVVLVVYLCG